MYVSIDIETTGMDPEKDQVLEVAAVLNVNDALLNCPQFHSIIKHDRIMGSPYALSLNAGLLKNIADGGGTRPENFCDNFTVWLQNTCGASPDNKVTLLGKNVGSFDFQFLKRMKGGFPTALCNYRMLDVNSLCAMPEGMSGMKDEMTALANYFNIPGEEHEAMYDALSALALARAKWKLEGMSVIAL